VIILFFSLHKSEPDVKPAPVAPKAAVEPAKPAAPVAAATPAPPKPAVVVPPGTALLTEANAELAKQSYVLAVDALLRASQANADAAQVGALALTLDKAVGDKLVAAHKHKDRAGEIEAKTLLAKLRPLLPAKKRPVAARHR
jgi:hypothetical protein